MSRYRVRRGQRTAEEVWAYVFTSTRWKDEAHIIAGMPNAGPLLQSLLKKGWLVTKSMMGRTFWRRDKG